MNTVEIIDRGLKCLSDNLGADETEIFISTILRERFDYTKWRHTFIDDINTFEKLDDFVNTSKNIETFKGNVEQTL